MENLDKTAEMAEGESEEGSWVDPPLSPIGTHSPALESFTDTVFLILLVIIGDGHHDNTITGNSWVTCILDMSEWSKYAKEETQS